MLFKLEYDNKDKGGQPKTSCYEHMNCKGSLTYPFRKFLAFKLKDKNDSFNENREKDKYDG